MASWREAHLQRVLALEAAASALILESLRAVMSPLADMLGTITAAGAGEAVTSLDDLASIPRGWAGQVDDAILPWFGGIFEAGGDAAEDQLRAIGAVVPGGDREFLDAVAAQYLANARARFTTLGDDAWERARAGLLEGFREGEGISQLRSRVRAVTDLSEAAADSLARTEVIAASNMGAQARVDAMGSQAPPYRQWLSTLDGRTRPTHVRADGQVVERREPFQVGAATLRVPGDPAGPPEEVRNCRCTVLFTESPEPLEVEGRQEGGVVDYVADSADVTPDGLPELPTAPQGVDALGPNARNSPGGRPVSAAVDLDATPEALQEGTRRALAAINRVHGDGALRSLAVRDSGSQGSGFYEWGKSIAVRASNRPLRQAQIVMHEVGHWLDHQGLPVGELRRGAFGMASDAVKVASSAELDADPVANALFDLTAALRFSPEVKDLRDREKRARDAGTSDAEWYQYLLEETEVFARAYHQWIALRSGDPDLWEEFDVRRSEYGGDPVQWEDGNFEPLAEAFDNYFRMVGWMA